MHTHAHTPTRYSVTQLSGLHFGVDGVTFAPAIPLSVGAITHAHIHAHTRTHTHIYAHIYTQAVHSVGEGKSLVVIDG